MSKSKFQLLSCIINLGAARDNTAYRGTDDPVTLPEVAILQAIHGGPEHVYDLVSIGETDERSAEDEFSRLAGLYGDKVVRAVFPPMGNTFPLPVFDDSFPTLDEVTAGEVARVAAMTRAPRASKKATKAEAAKSDAPAPVVETAALPALDQLPSE